MSFACYILLLDLLVAPILDLANAGFGAELAMTAAGMSLLAIATNARSIDRDHFFRASAGLRWAMLLIPACIGAQLIPVWLIIAHPIWRSVYDALNGVPSGFITADFGNTLLAFFSSLALMSLVAVTMIVARDRRRAEQVLFASNVAITATALFVMIQRLKIGSDSLAAAAAFSGFGLLLNCAVMQFAAERAETRHPLARSIAVGSLGAFGALINGTVVFAFCDENTAIALGLGIAVFLLVLVIRRLDLSNLAAVALSAALLMGTLIVLTWVFEKAQGPAVLRLAPALPDETTAALARLLGDTRLFGAGAGAFESVARIYQNSEAAGLLAPSAAAAVFVDTGWIGAIIAMTTSIAVLIRLYVGALRRGRDSFFASTAAACLCFAVVESFIGPGLLHAAATTVLSVIVGLGLSQSVSPSPRSNMS